MSKRDSSERLNIIEEVGRDPLRVSPDTPPEQVLDESRKLAAARESLRSVLPQPYRHLPMIPKNIILGEE